MRIFFTIILFSCCLCSMSDADTGTLPVKFQFCLSQPSILQGEPLSMMVTVEANNQKNKYSGEYVLNPYRKSMTLVLYDSLLKPFGARRPLPVWPSSQWRGPVFSTVDSRGTSFEIPVHLFVSTDVPEGKYYLKLTSLCVHIGNDANEHMFYDLTSPMLPIVVKARNPERLIAQYSELLQHGLAENKEKYQHGWIGNDWVDYPNSLRMLMWAYGPLAVRSQIDGLYDKEHHRFRYWGQFTIHTYQNLLENASLADVKRLVAIAESPEFLRDESSDGFDSNLIWLFQGLKKKGDSDIIPLIETTLSRFPKAVNIRQMENPQS